MPGTEYILLTKSNYHIHTLELSLSTFFDFVKSRRTTVSTKLNYRIHIGVKSFNFLWLCDVKAYNVGVKSFNFLWAKSFNFVKSRRTTWELSLSTFFDFMKLRRTEFSDWAAVKCWYEFIAFCVLHYMTSLILSPLHKMQTIFSRRCI